MSNICDVQLPEVKDVGISSDTPVPLVLYKGQIMPMQPGMQIPACFLRLTPTRPFLPLTPEQPIPPHIPERPLQQGN